MITPQDIREKTFEKAVFGGYDAGAVDDFLETLANDLTLLQKENATLKGKMKVLVDKVEEYRGNEDALRMAVVSAQRLGNIIEAEARERAAAMVSEATENADRMTREARLEVEMEKARLSEAKKTSVQFVDNMELLCNRQLSFLGKIGEMDFIKETRASRIVDVVPEETPAPIPASADSNEIHETVKSIEETVAKVADEPVNTVRPSFVPADGVDELPTRAYHIVTDPEDDTEKTTRFSFDGFEK